MAERSDLGGRILLALAGLVGAAGVISAAASSHGEVSRNLLAIAAICLSHGPALLALALAGQGRVLRLAGAFLAAGTVIFAGDLGMREWLGHGLFAGAAPIGGLVIILGWAGVVLAGVIGRLGR